MRNELLATLGSVSCRAASLLGLPRYTIQLAYGAYSGQESPADVLERLGLSQLPRPNGPVLWFHALSLGESAVALPLIFRCLLEYNEHVHVLLTTGAAEARALLSTSLPSRVKVQYVPLDNHICMQLFLAHWRPQACILMESPALPALVEACAAANVRLALLNARMSSKSFLAWFNSRCKRALLGRMLANFSLIVPQSDIDVGRFRILGATLAQMPGWCSDLKYAAALGTSVWHLWRPRPHRISSVRRALAGRPIWVAAYTAPGEEEAIAGVHVKLQAEWANLLTVIMPRTPARTSEVAEMLKQDFLLQVVLWSQVMDTIAPTSPLKNSSHSASARSRAPANITPAAASTTTQHPGAVTSASEAATAEQQAAADAAVLLLKGVDILLLDVPSDLPLMYSVSEIAFAGNSLLEGCGGHNLAEAAVAGCAVLVGEHAGHFNTMVDELNQAAVMAAEEAAAAVNSSGPLEDPFGYNHAAAANSSGGAADQPAPSTAAAAAAITGLEGDATAAGEEPSPRDGSHWRGAIEQQSSGGTVGTAAIIIPAQQQQHQQLGRPSTAPAAYQAAGAADRHESSNNSGGQHAAAAEVSAASTGRPGSAMDPAARAAAAGGSSSAAAARNPVNSGAGRHSSNVWVNYASTLGDCGGGGGGVLGALGENDAEDAGGVLLGNESLLSLPNGSGHVYEQTGIGAPPPSASSSALFTGGHNTGEVTPASSSGGGAADHHHLHQHQQQQQQQQQEQLPQGDGYAQAYAQQRLHSNGSSMRFPQQQGVGNSNGDRHHHGSNRQQQQCFGSGSPPCPMTPATPYPTPEDSAISFGGRSPLSPHSGAVNGHQQQQQRHQHELVNSALTHPAHLLSQQMTHSSNLSWGGDSSNRSTDHGAPAAAADAAESSSSEQLPWLSSGSNVSDISPDGNARLQDPSVASEETATLGPAVNAAEVEAAEAEDLADDAPATGFFMSLSGIANTDEQQQQRSPGSRGLQRPLNPTPPDRFSSDGTAADEDDSRSPANGNASSGDSSVTTPALRRRSDGGSSGSSTTPLRWPGGGGAWRGASSGGEPMNAGSAEGEGVIHESTPAAAAAAAAGGDHDGRGMGRSPTIAELVAAHDSCVAAAGAAATTADGSDLGDRGDSPSNGGSQSVDLYPALAAAAAAASATVEVVDGQTGRSGVKSDNLGWEDWDKQHKQQQQLIKQQQQQSELVVLDERSDRSSECSSSSIVDCNGTTVAAAAADSQAAEEDSAAAEDGSNHSREDHHQQQQQVTDNNSLQAVDGVDSSGGAQQAAAAVQTAAVLNNPPMRQSSSGAGIGGGASRLGDPTRATHYMDISSQQQQQQLPQVMPVAIPQQQQGSQFDSNSGSGSGGQPGSTSFTNNDVNQQQQQQQQSGRSSVVETPRGNSNTVSWYNPAAAAGGGGSSAAAYFHNEGSSASLLDMDGRATPSSVYSVASTSTDFAATPMWRQQQQQQHGYHQHRVGLNSSSDGQTPAAAAGHGSSRRSHRHSGVSQTGDRPLADGLWGRFGGLSGTATPAGHSCSETATPHCPDTPSGSATPAAAIAARQPAAAAAADPYIVPGTSYLRYRGEYILPATHLPYAPHGPAVWRVSGADGLAAAVATLLQEPLERRSRGHAATQAAAKLASGLVSTVWHVVDDVVVAPALQDYVAQHGAPGRDSTAAAARAPTRVLGHLSPRS